MSRVCPSQPDQLTAHKIKGQFSAHPESLNPDVQSVPVFAQNVLLRVEVQKVLKRVQPHGQHILGGSLTIVRRVPVVASETTTARPGTMPENPICDCDWPLPS
jgi:hypothetical protein